MEIERIYAADAASEIVEELRRAEYYSVDIPERLTGYLLSLSTELTILVEKKMKEVEG